jgi:hypothetical protein
MRVLRIVPAFLAVGLLGCEPNAPTDAGPDVVSFDRIPGADNGGSRLTANLTGDAEVHLGDLDGSGAARVTLNQGQGEVCFEIMVADITLPALAAHIHSAPAGANGSVVVALAPPDATGSSSGCVSADAGLIQAIGLSPSDYYVNVHTIDFPAGAVRGQLMPPGAHFLTNRLFGWLTVDDDDEFCRGVVLDEFGFPAPPQDNNDIWRLNPDGTIDAIVNAEKEATLTYFDFNTSAWYEGVGFMKGHFFDIFGADPDAQSVGSIRGDVTNVGDPSDTRRLHCQIDAEEETNWVRLK